MLHFDGGGNPFGTAVWVYSGLVCHVILKIMTEASIHRESKFPIQVQNRMLYDKGQNPKSMPNASIIWQSTQWWSFRIQQTLLNDRNENGRLEI